MPSLSSRICREVELRHPHPGQEPLHAACVIRVEMGQHQG